MRQPVPLNTDTINMDDPPAPLFEVSTPEDQHLLLTLLGSILFWEVLFRSVSHVMNNTDLAERITLDASTTQTLKACAPSYVCSIVHSTVVGVMGVIHLIEMWPVNDVMLQLSRASYSIMSTNLIFMGYLVYDICHVLGKYPKLGGADMVAHHCVFVTASMINGNYRIMPFAFGWLIVGELSTIFLNLRWFWIKTGRGHTQAMNVTQILFAISFFVLRVVIYLMGVGHLLYHHDGLRRLYQEGIVPFVFLSITLTFIVAGSLLNLMWFQKIFQMAFGKAKSKAKSK